MENLLNGINASIDASELALAAHFADGGAWMTGLVFSLFALINSLRILAYVPQILRAAQDENGATAISFTTWGLFLASHLTTIAYALVCVHDIVMALFFLGNAAACGVILGITFAKRRAHAARARRMATLSGVPAE